MYSTFFVKNKIFTYKAVSVHTMKADAKEEIYAHHGVICRPRPPYRRKKILCTNILLYCGVYFALRNFFWAPVLRNGTRSFGVDCHTPQH
jgi:hypothetical protein